MPDNDSQTELKKRARRRLVGAAALALLAAVVLPMVMDQEPKPSNGDIQIRIPRQEQSAPLRMLPPDDPPASPIAPAASSGKGGSAGPPVVREEAAKPSDTRIAKVEATASEEGAAKPTAKPSDKPAPAKADMSPGSAVEAVEAEKWVVQLGAFRNAGNVKHLQAKLKSEGFASFTEPLVSPGGKKTRVRAGPFSSREAAEKARERLKRIGLDGVVAQQR